LNLTLDARSFIWYIAVFLLSINKAYLRTSKRKKHLTRLKISATSVLVQVIRTTCASSTDIKETYEKGNKGGTE
jgi:hypothetical protein